MTYVLERCENDKYYINIEITGTLYFVNVYPILSDNICGYPIKRMAYSLSDKKNAYRTYRRYIKRYTE